MKITINENQRGLLFNHGKFVKMLDSGTYHGLPGRTVELLDLENPIQSEVCAQEILMQDKTISRQSVTVEVGDEQLALHFVNGHFRQCLRRGRYMFWTIYDKHEFQIVDISTPEIGDNVPEYILEKLPTSFYTKVTVNAFQKARLYFNKKLVRLLDVGIYYFWNTKIRVEADFVDTRRTQMNISGQEILTLDKVNLRINFVCTYRITDYVRVLTEIDDYKEQMHVAIQLALREYVGKFRLDDILANKDQISTYVFERLKAMENQWFVEILDAGVKDIVLPGEIRDIMNTVLLAEKRAQANVITRREEVASTRSLLNTARLMDENKTLYKLKELEYLEKICENVGNINVGGVDLLSQLSALAGAN